MCGHGRQTYFQVHIVAYYEYLVSIIGTSGLYKHEDCKPIDIFNWREYMEQHDSYGEGVPQLVIKN